MNWLRELLLASFWQQRLKERIMMIRQLRPCEAFRCDTMKIAVELDEELYAELQAAANSASLTLNSLINETLSVCLRQGQIANYTKTFRVRPVDLGGPLPGLSYDKISALLDHE